MTLPDMTHTLLYVADPMCSWCWGFAPSLTALQDELPANFPICYIMGGLAADSNEPMTSQVRNYIQENWRAVEAAAGVSFNWDFWEHCAPRRSTYPACRSVIAAQRQGAGPAMFFAIQRAYYVEARNPSDPSTLLELSAEIALDQPRFYHDLQSTETEALLQKDFDTRRKFGVREFPTLIYKRASAGSGNKQSSSVFLARGYADPAEVVDAFHKADGASLHD